MYKYVVMKDGKAVKWEQGPNRVADLAILPDKSRVSSIHKASGSPQNQSSFHKSRSIDSRHSEFLSQFSQGQKIKHVILKDEWETFTIRFSVATKFEGESEEDASQAARTNNAREPTQCMRIIGSLPELTKRGVMNSGPKEMKKCARRFRWMHDKYGQQMKPWECLVKLNIGALSSRPDIIYSYSNSITTPKQEIVYEREPSRLLKVQPPETYNGELGAQKSSQWKNWDKVWIVNGHIEKADGNFLGDLFLTRVGETGISFGNFPLVEQDVHRIKSSGCPAVLNLMMKSEFRPRGVNWTKLKDLYQLKQMKVLRYQVNDMKEKELVSNLFTAAQHLHKLLDAEKQRTFVHCSSGITRAPEVVIVYLCLYKRHRCWDDPDSVAQFVKTFNFRILPNMRAVKKCIEQNKDFQSA